MKQLNMKTRINRKIYRELLVGVIAEYAKVTFEDMDKYKQVVRLADKIMEVVDEYEIKPVVETGS